MRSSRARQESFCPLDKDSSWMSATLPQQNADDQSWISEGTSGFGIVASAASPVTRQRSDRPEQRNQKKQLAPRDTRAPCPEHTQGSANARPCHSCRPLNPPRTHPSLI